MAAIAAFRQLLLALLIMATARAAPISTLVPQDSALVADYDITQLADGATSLINQRTNQADADLFGGAFVQGGALHLSGAVDGVPAHATTPLFRSNFSSGFMQMSLVAYVKFNDVSGDMQPIFGALPTAARGSQFMCGRRRLTGTNPTAPDATPYSLSYDDAPVAANSVSFGNGALDLFDGGYHMVAFVRGANANKRLLAMWLDGNWVPVFANVDAADNMLHIVNSLQLDDRIIIGGSFKFNRGVAPFNTNQNYTLNGNIKRVLMYQRPLSFEELEGIYYNFTARYAAPAAPAVPDTACTAQATDDNSTLLRFDFSANSVGGVWQDSTGRWEALIDGTGVSYSSSQSGLVFDGNTGKVIIRKSGVGASLTRADLGVGSSYTIVASVVLDQQYRASHAFMGSDSDSVFSTFFLGTHAVNQSANGGGVGPGVATYLHSVDGEDNLNELPADSMYVLGDGARHALTYVGAAGLGNAVVALVDDNFRSYIRRHQFAPNTSLPLTLGYYRNGTTTRFFKGVISSLRIFSRKLSDTELRCVQQPLVADYYAENLVMRLDARQINSWTSGVSNTWSDVHQPAGHVATFSSSGTSVTPSQARRDRYASVALNGGYGTTSLKKTDLFGRGLYANSMSYTFSFLLSMADFAGISNNQALVSTVALGATSVSQFSFFRNPSTKYTSFGVREAASNNTINSAVYNLNFTYDSQFHTKYHTLTLTFSSQRWFNGTANPLSVQYFSLYRDEDQRSESQAFFVPTGVFVGAQPFLLGATDVFGARRDYFIGNVAAMLVWDRPLSDIAVQRARQKYFFTCASSNWTADGATTVTLPERALNEVVSANCSSSASWVFRCEALPLAEWRLVVNPAECGTTDPVPYFFSDMDFDSYADHFDKCPNDTTKHDDIDSDQDGILDCNDRCPADPLKSTPGLCGCGVVDSALDYDGDGLIDCLDGCPNDPLKNSTGLCGCGVADADTDGDHTPNCHDGCPNDQHKTAPLVCGCGNSDTDSDGDGTADCVDGCPSDSQKVAPGSCGCGVVDSPSDIDGDGVLDCRDLCRTDPSKSAPGVCGCGVIDFDTDGDGSADCVDGCPSDSAKTVPGLCGCGFIDDPTDSDQDGTLNCIDGCPNDPHKIMSGVCGCGIADVDTDNDTVADCDDRCPTDRYKVTEGSCGCGVADTDTDADGTPDCTDLCPADPLKVVKGICGCGESDHDTDNDTVADCDDACPIDPLKAKPGACGCGVSDVDTDHDMTPDCDDGCPQDVNKTAPGACGCGVSDLDSDGDGVADCNDWCLNDPTKTAPGVCGCNVPDIDSDADGTFDCVDSCPWDAHKVVPGVCGCNVTDVDTDSDSVPDCLDECPTDANKTHGGICGCFHDDADSDADGVADCHDECPHDALKTHTGVCGCGVSDVDSDSDGTADCLDGCSANPLKIAPGACGCEKPDTDTDGDLTADCHDRCIYDPLKVEPGICGCGVADTDSDGDGVQNCNEECDDDPLKTQPLICGCGVPETDADNDGIPACQDSCESDPHKTAPGICGCGVPDVDADADGFASCQEECDNDPYKIQAGVCGCGVSDIDADHDGVPACHDACDNDPAKVIQGACGCGVADTDTDGDSVPDCNDACPHDPAKTAPGQCGCGLADTDNDGDGYANCIDLCPQNPTKIAPGVCTCVVDDVDSDGDGTPDCNDLCPLDVVKVAPGACGCNKPETGDMDNDGVKDCNDQCPSDPNKSVPGECGCSRPETPGCLPLDQCPDDPTKTMPGICGCGHSDFDSDLDGVADCVDLCPFDRNKTAPGVCGCSRFENIADDDHDGTVNCFDACPKDALKTQPMMCGCGVAETDTDLDGVPDCLDGCPSNPARKRAPCNCRALSNFPYSHAAKRLVKFNKGTIPPSTYSNWIFDHLNWDPSRPLVDSPFGALGLPYHQICTSNLALSSSVAFALGRGGSIIVQFQPSFHTTLSVWDIGWPADEQALVEVSADGDVYYRVGVASAATSVGFYNRESRFSDLRSAILQNNANVTFVPPCFSFVRITDLTPANAPNTRAGFALHSLSSTRRCTECSDDETVLDCSALPSAWPERNCDILDITLANSRSTNRIDIISSGSTWITSTQASGFIGNDYLVDGGDPKKTDRYVFVRPPPALPGPFTIDVWIPASQKSSDHSQYKVVYANGTRTFNLDQHIDDLNYGGSWIALGSSYTLDPANVNHGVRIGIDGRSSDGALYVDAVRYCSLTPGVFFHSTVIDGVSEGAAAGLMVGGLVIGGVVAAVIVGFPKFMAKRKRNAAAAQMEGGAPAGAEAEMSTLPPASQFHVRPNPSSASALARALLSSDSQGSLASRHSRQQSAADAASHSRGLSLQSVAAVYGRLEDAPTQL